MRTLLLAALCGFFVSPVWASHIQPGVCESLDKAKAAIATERQSAGASYATLEGELAAHIMAAYNAHPPPSEIVADSVLTVFDGPRMMVGATRYVLLAGFNDGCLSFHAVVPAEIFAKWMRDATAKPGTDS